MQAGKDLPILLFMVQKSGKTHLGLYKTLSKNGIFTISARLAGVLNHQQYVLTSVCVCLCGSFFLLRPRVSGVEFMESPEPESLPSTAPKGTGDRTV